MSNVNEVKGAAKFTRERAREFTAGRGVHAYRHVRRPGRMAMRHEGSRFRGHRA